jgi:HSP20 family protein
MKIIKFGDHDGHKDRHPMTLRQAMQRMFDESFWDPFGMLGDTFPRSMELASQFMPTIDVAETEKELLIEANIPGYDPKDIEIDVHDNVLTIHGTTHQDTEEKDKKYYRRERGYGEFRREIMLPDYVDIAKASCKAKNGTIVISVPKKHADQHHVRKIPIES